MYAWLLAKIERVSLQQLARLLTVTIVHSEANSYAQIAS